MSQRWTNDPDVRVLTLLKEAGSDLSKPHPIDFYLYLPTREAAEEVAEILKGEDYKVSVVPGADDVNWLCLASKAIVPTLEKIKALEARFWALMEPRNGDYDGWEAAVVK